MTVLSCLTSFHLWPAGGATTTPLPHSTSNSRLEYFHLLITAILICKKVAQRHRRNKKTHLLQLMLTSFGMTRLFSMPCLGWLPRPRNRPGGSILKLPIFCLWPSMMQKPNSFTMASLAFLISCQTTVQPKNCKSNSKPAIK